MKILIIFITLLIMFLAIIILDYLWLGIITRKFLINQFGSLISVKNGGVQIKLAVGLLAWLVIVSGCFIFAVNPSETLTKAVILGATFGFISYAIYDLTNLAFIVDYPVKFVFADIVWGTVLCSIVSSVGFFIKNLF